MCICIYVYTYTNRYKQINRQKIVHNPNFERLPNIATLLTSWRRLLRAVNSDGSWARVPVEVLSRASTVATHAALTAEFIHIAKQIIIDIQEIPNRMRRQKAASALLDKVNAPSSTVALGDALTDRLSKLMQGKWPEKKEGEADQAEEEDDDVEHDEPARKKARE